MNGGASVIWNDTTRNHERSIRTLLTNAKRFDCAVAFAKWSGFEPLQKILVGRLKAGMQARFVVGLDFCQSEPRVLKELLALKRKYGIEVYVSVHKDSSTFHPKVYRFEHADAVSLLIGSANLTRGGLSNNHEISGILRLKRERRVFSYMNELVDDRDIEELNPDILVSYQKRYAAYHVLRRIAERRIKHLIKDKKTGIYALRGILREMKQGGTDSKFAIQTRIRQRSRRQARSILTRIKKAPHFSRTTFLPLYDQLARGVWHSGGLHRSKTRIANSPGVFQEIVRAAAERHIGRIGGVFEHLRELADQASGIGPNVLTEILHTYDNRRYAVMNQNSVAGIQLAGFSDFPEKPNRGSVDGSLYERFCRQADAIRQELSLEDLSQLDAVFNYAYWRDEDEGDEG